MSVVCSRLQKKETFLKPMVDVIVKEGKDKWAKFECVFSRSKMRPKWTHKRDVSCFFIIETYQDNVVVNHFCVFQPDISDFITVVSVFFSQEGRTITRSATHVHHCWHCTAPVGTASFGTASVS